MGKDPSAERPRRSSSRPVTLTTDRYGRRVRDWDEKERGYKRRDFERDDSRERKDMISIRRGRGREDSREREWNYRRGTEEAYPHNRRNLDGNHPESSDGKKHSRWSKTSQYGHANIVNEEPGKIEQSNGGVYGPADWNRGVGGRNQWNGSPRDESWVEFRLKLRAEAAQPRGVWNTSPSPPRRKVVKVTQVDKVKSSSVEIAEKIQRTGRRKKIDDKNDSSSGSSSGSSSDSCSHSESVDSDSSGDECANSKETLGKRKKRPLPTKTVSGRYLPINNRILTSCYGTGIKYLHSLLSNRRGKDGRTLIMPMSYLNLTSVNRASIEDYCPCVGEYSGLNAIDTQLRDLITSGLALTV